MQAFYPADGKAGTGMPGPVITVQVRSNYGTDMVYPMDDQAALFAALLKVKTFNAHQVRTIRALGYAVHVAAGSLPAGF